MKVPPINPSSLEEFNKLPKSEQLKYKLKGAVIDELNRVGYCGVPGHLKPADEFTYWGMLMARVGRIIKGISRK